MDMSPVFEETAEQIFKILVSGESYGSDLGRHVFLFCPGPKGGPAAAERSEALHLTGGGVTSICQVSPFWGSSDPG